MGNEDDPGRLDSSATTLDELVSTISPEPLSALVVDDPRATVSDVAIVDPIEPGAVERGQVLLAVGVDVNSLEARELVERCAEGGAAGLVFRVRSSEPPQALIDDARTAGLALFTARAEVGWSQIFALLRALVAGAAFDPTPQAARLVPGDLFGVAEAIAAMVGGSVILYDHAHVVLAHAVAGFDIDEVRRETILGRRTPQQWVKRFTEDESAYRTAREPGQVIRVEHYAGLRTRLRIGVHLGDELLGEISVAEGRQSLGEDSEAALRRAAELAVPHLTRHRIAQTSEREVRWTMLRSILAGKGPTELHAKQLGLNPVAEFSVVGIQAENPRATDELAVHAFSERVLQFVSLHTSGFNSKSAILLDEGVHLALVPTGDEAARRRLLDVAGGIVSDLDGLGITAIAAVGSRVEGLEEAARSRREVMNLLSLLRRQRREGIVATPESHWHELFLIEIEVALSGGDWQLSDELERLRHHDREHQSEYVRTLRAYLDAFGSVSHAADALVMHPNSLRHRMKRLSETAGFDLEDSTQRLAIDLQLRLLEAAEAEGTAPSQ